MTIIMMYKKDASSKPVIAGDRAVMLQMPLPTMDTEPHYGYGRKRTFYYRGKSPKCALKEGVLIGGAGHKDLVRFVVNDMQFPIPYLIKDSYNFYVSTILVYEILTAIECDRTKRIIQDNMGASFIFSIEKQTYWLNIEYPNLGVDPIETYTRGNILYSNDVCVVSEMNIDANLMAIGEGGATDEALKYINSLGSRIDSMTEEQVLTNAYKKASNVNRCVGLGLDIMHG